MAYIFILVLCGFLVAVTLNCIHFVYTAITNISEEE